MTATYNNLLGERIKECSYVLLLLRDIGGILVSPKYLSFPDCRNEAILHHSTALDRSNVVKADDQAEELVITRLLKME